MSEQLAEYKSQEIVTAAQDPSHMLALAVSKGVDPAVLEKMMDLSERYNASLSRKAFVLAMTRFKAEVPPVLAKDAAVDFTSQKGRTHYKYANLGSIVAVVTPLLCKQELSAAWETSQNEKGEVVVTCHITHSAGHRESVCLRGLPDNSGGKNPIQMIGSTVEYLRRYTFLCATGLATGDVDTDGLPPERMQREPVQQQPATCSEAQIKRLYALCKSTGGDTATLADRLAARFRYVRGADGIHLSQLQRTDYAAAEVVAQAQPASGPAEKRTPTVEGDVRADAEPEDDIPMGDEPAKTELLPPPKVKAFWPEDEFEAKGVEIIHAQIVNVIAPVKGKTGKFGPYKVEVQHDGQVITLDTFDTTLAALAQAFGAGGEQQEIAYSKPSNPRWNAKLEGLR